MNARQAARLRTASAIAAVGCASLLASPALGQAPEPQPAEIQVVGRARIEKPAEIFRIEVQIVERARNQVAALEAAAEKLDLITAGVASLEGLESYSISSDEASTSVAREYGCGFDGGYGEDRPRDCSPIEVGALLYFSFEGAPASAAGAVVAFMAESGAETVDLQGFDVADRGAAEREAKQAALADAVATAEALAEGAGVEIARPKLIRFGDAGRFAPEEYSSERIVVTGSRLARPQVQLALSPPPVEFSAEVAVSFEIE